MADEHTSDVSGETPSNLSNKKPFDPPRLTVYGDITTLTRAVGRTGSGDGGKGNTQRTRP